MKLRFNNPRFTLTNGALNSRMRSYITWHILFRNLPNRVGPSMRQNTIVIISHLPPPPATYISKKSSSTPSALQGSPQDLTPVKRVMR